MKHKLAMKVMSAISGLSILFSGCTAPPPFTAEEVLNNYFSANEFKDYSKSSLELSDEYFKILDNRIRIRLPEGTEQPTQEQLRIISRNPRKLSQIFTGLFWAKDNELLALYANELFVHTSGDIVEDARMHLDDWGKSSDYIIYKPNVSTSLPIALATETKDWKSEKRNEGFPVLTAVVAGKDGNLIRLGFEIYTLKPERLDMYQKLVEEICLTISPGGRILETNGVTEKFENIMIKIEPEYAGAETGSEEIITFRNYKSRFLKRDKFDVVRENVKTYIIKNVREGTDPTPSIDLQFGKNLLSPTDSEDDDATWLEDTILGETIMWKVELYGDSVNTMEAVILLDNEDSLRMKLLYRNEKEKNELLKMARSLEKT